jgi:hypothetical protein
MSDLKFETLIEENHCSARWYPSPVDYYNKAFKIDDNVKNSKALRKNLSYSMQYLEFLEKELDELHVSSVISVILIKTYVVTGMSLLEGIFTNIIKSRGWWKTTDLQSVIKLKSNPGNVGKEQYLVETEIFKKVSPYEIRMNLDGMIKILQHHHEALNVNYLVYPALKRLKDLRNRVHLQMLESTTDHDYNAFGPEVKEEMGAILYTILTSEMVSDMPEAFDFLKKNVRVN